MIEVSENLKNLAQQVQKVGHKLYLVGGYVRNSLLGFDVNDLDISGSLTATEMRKVCKVYGYSVDIVNKKLGTLLIQKDGERYEYTTFRKEVYDESGKHKPDEVEFVEDPNTDARRRDFTVNAIYYDIMTGEILDFFDGQKDIKRKLLKTTVAPEVVFTDDGLRILRLIRFTCELGFKPEKKTYESAKNFAYKVADISKERILNEIKIAINGGLKYHLKNTTHGNVVKYYNNLNLWQYAINPVLKTFRVKASGKMYKAYLKSDGSCRYVAFMCMLLYNYIKARSSEKNIAFSVSQLLGNDGLKESNKNFKDVLDAYSFVNKLLFYKDDEFITNKNCLIYENLPFETKTYLSLINADRINKIKLQIMQMRKTKVPFFEAELKVNATDLIENAKINPKFISKIKSTLFEMCVEGMIINDKEILLEQAKFLNEKLINILAQERKQAYEFNRKKQEFLKSQNIAEVKEQDVEIVEDNSSTTQSE